MKTVPLALVKIAKCLHEQGSEHHKYCDAYQNYTVECNADQKLQNMHSAIASVLEYELELAQLVCHNKSFLVKDYVSYELINIVMHHKK